jgi:hypothetical protein
LEYETVIVTYAGGNVQLVSLGDGPHNSELQQCTLLDEFSKTKKPDTGDPLHTQEPVTVASFRTWRGWRECVARDRCLTYSILTFTSEFVSVGYHDPLWTLRELVLA